MYGNNSREQRHPSPCPYNLIPTKLYVLEYNLAWYLAVISAYKINTHKNLNIKLLLLIIIHNNDDLKTSKKRYKRQVYLTSWNTCNAFVKSVYDFFYQHN